MDRSPVPACAGRAGPRPIIRSALLAMLDRPAWLTTLIAGPGAGKTTLLAAWGGGSAAVIRAGLRPDDADLSVFRHTLAQALSQLDTLLPVGVRAALMDSGLDASPTDHDRAEGLAALLAAAFDRTASAGSPVGCTVVVDDLHLLPAGGAPARLVEALCRHRPDGLHLVLASRQPLPFPVDRLRAEGQLVEVGPAGLAFGEDETYQVLAGALGDAAQADELAPDLHLLTGGWPALVALSAGWLGQQPAARRPLHLARLGHAAGPLAEHLAVTLLAAEAPQVRELVRAAANLPSVDACLVTALDLGRPPAGDTTGPADRPGGPDLARLAPFLEPLPPGDGRYAVAAALREIVLTRSPLPADERRALLTAAIDWYSRSGRLDDAFVAARTLDEPAATGRLLAAHGTGLIAAGRVADVAAAAAGVPGPLRCDALELVEGDARQVRGDLAGALACYRRIAGVTDGEAGAGVADGEGIAGVTDGEAALGLPAGLAHRIGNIHHVSGDLDAALAAYRRGRLETGRDADEAILLSRIAGVHWLRGDDVACRDAARRALDTAIGSGDDRALAAAYDALAQVAERTGDWTGHAGYTGRALAAAVRAGDLMGQLRTRISRSQRLLEESRFAAALAELDEAMRLVESIGAPERRAIVHVNRGWAYRGLGRLDEAVAEMEVAARIWRGAGSALVAYALVGLGAVYLVRGDLPAAETALTEAYTLAERTGDAQSWAALATLSRVRYATDPDSATRLAERALHTHTGLWRVWALLSAGWIALLRGDRAAAAGYAEQAGEVGVRRQDRSAQAEQIELRALVCTDRERRLRLLREAQERYARLGNATFVARTVVTQARVVGEPAATRVAEARLTALGVRPEAALAAGPLRVVGAFAEAAAVSEDAFLVAVRTGLAHWQRGDPGAATAVLEPAMDARPAGRDAGPGYLIAIRTLAGAAAGAGSPDAALRWYLRLLEHEPYDEVGHLGAVRALVEAGRHGEARHRYRLYIERMRERGIEPASYPGLSHRTAPG